MQITFETRKRITGFYILRYGVPEGRSRKGYASFKQVQPWPWHVEVNCFLGMAISKPVSLVLCMHGHKDSFGPRIWVGTTLKDFVKAYSKERSHPPRYPTRCQVHPFSFPILSEH